jgi:hypothetical protein
VDTHGAAAGTHSSTVGPRRTDAEVQEA